MDIKGFFGALDHRFVMAAVSRFTQCKWTLLYIGRWLKADAILPDGTQVERYQGTPQGGVISSLLANIFLHLCFDNWMEENFPQIHFERYADDIVVHCRSHKQLKYLERESSESDSLNVNLSSAPIRLRSYIVKIQTVVAHIQCRVSTFLGIHSDPEAHEIVTANSLSVFHRQPAESRSRRRGQRSSSTLWLGPVIV